MVVVAPSAQKAALEAERPATRAEVAAILFKMMEQEHSFTVTKFFQPKNLISECFEFIEIAILNVFGLFTLYCYTGILPCY